MKKKVLVLGSTGSIGRATLDVIEHLADKFEVVGLACKENLDLLTEQVKKFRPSYVSIYGSYGNTTKQIGTARVLRGMDGIKEMIGMDVHTVVNAMPGSVGLEPTIETLRQNRVLALANKESLVMAGRLVRRFLKEGSGKLIPVDSEHSALYQLLCRVPSAELKTLVITASGGPFWNHRKDALKKVRLEEALKHPTWKMGSKITLDSATLMNKGLEVIEARWLFDIEGDRIKVLVHPESIIHGIVEFVDNGFISYMSYPDMRIPISYALNEEERHPLPFGKLTMEGSFGLTFHPPDPDRFPCLRIAYEALNYGDSAMIAMNSANEIAAQAFMDRRIGFTDIPSVIEDAVQHHPTSAVIDTLDAIWEIHEWTKDYTEKKIEELYD
ncbi:MAG: 1-deoxy-D-xylulose-5-phosphate reductoisomerase [Syntrophobacterales bacterium]|jgi:1-deoxy-D-xylulose-5-phosphate reductoisomerase|nr:1-deoxy-D-xylulose-5-phosphate reductoisomerase [Syntrophobacterales bacterium]